MGGGMEIPQDDGEMNADPMGNEGMEDGSEGNDAKKEIQRMTGKLSQDLRTYNDDNGDQDTELNKYVANMIVKQAAKSMTPSDVKAVVGTLNDGSSSESDTNDSSKDNYDDSDNDNDNGQTLGGNSSPVSMPTESRRYIVNLVNEIVGDLANQSRETERSENKSANTKLRKRNPFISNR
jgi:hypothetical protein